VRPRPSSIPPGQAAKLIISNSPPMYPPKAKAAGIEGTVVVLAQINKSGGVDLARVVSGPEPLRQAALHAVKSWVYRPYLIDGSPAGFRTLVHVKFTIEKPRAQSSPHN
jgi:periplasmic protein TonB